MLRYFYFNYRDRRGNVYMVTFNRILTDRMIVQKEVWYDRASLLPKEVRFYDPNGRMILDAFLSDSQSLNDDKSAPKMATQYELRFLQTHTKLVLKLRELRDRYKNIPNDRTFRFPGTDVASNTRRVDEASEHQQIE